MAEIQRTAIPPHVKNLVPLSPFGRWRVIRFVEVRKKKAWWWCLCDPVLGGCGTERAVASNLLTNGESRSCGCLVREIQAARHTKHGFSATPEHKAWRAMINRCTDPKSHAWADYGGRGIVVCARWRESFENFLADMGLRPDGCSLDRIDNDKGYCPENCRWISQKQQTRNRRSSRLVSFNGRTQTAAEWAEELGFSRTVVSSRLNHGWSVEEALTVPVRQR